MTRSSQQTEDELQRSVYNFRSTVKDFDMKICTVEIRTMSFQGKDTVRSKIVFRTKLLNKLIALNKLVVISHKKIEKTLARMF